MSQIKERTILIADDDPSSTLAVEAALSQAGYTVLVAEGGEQALELFDRQRPDCLVLDVMMPDLSGVEVCRRLRARPESRRLPILMLTNLSDHASINECYNAGASDFTSKGRNPRLLVERVRFLLRERVLDDEWRSSQLRLEQAQRIARIGHWELDTRGRSISVSPLVCELLGGGVDAILGYDVLLARLPSAEAEAARRAFAECAGSGQGFACDHRLQGPDSQPLFIHQETQLMRRNAEQPDDVVLITLQDVTRLRLADEPGTTRLYTDIATGLPNRRHYEEQVAAALASERGVATTTLLAVRIRNLDRAVAAHGEDLGSALISELSDRVAVALAPLLGDAIAAVSAREEIVVARIAGDELGVLLRGELSSERVAAATASMLDAVARPVVCLGIEYAPVATAGIAMAGVDGANPEDLMLHAHIAANQASEACSYSFYSADLQTRARRHCTLEADLREAIDRGQLRLVYQPRIRPRDRTVVGVEALLRWEHPRFGLVSPAEFLPIAERSGQILDIDRWVLDAACADLSRLRVSGAADLRVAVNLSSRLVARRGVEKAVQRALTQHALPAEALELEVTEPCLDAADAAARGSLEALRAVGVQVTLDDFGSGKFSIGQIRRLPVDCLKLDEALIAELRTDRGVVGVVAGVLAIARALGIRSCAEGVEDAITLQMLADLDCDEVQGYYFARPQPAAALQAWLAAGGAAAESTEPHQTGSTASTAAARR